MNLRDNSLGGNYVLSPNWAILTIFGLNFLQKTANRDFVKILRFAVSVFLNFYCGSVLIRFGLDTLMSMSLVLWHKNFLIWLGILRWCMRLRTFPRKKIVSRLTLMPKYNAFVDETETKPNHIENEHCH